MSTGKILKIKSYLHCRQYSLSYKFNNKKEKSKKNNKEESLRCSASRACSLLKDYILSNEFEYFVTYTIASDLKFDIDNACLMFNKTFQNYSLNAKRKGYNFKYCYVFELTKNKGVHVHGFFSGFYDLYENQYGHLSSKYFDKIGYQCFDDAEKINEFYLFKYIIKSEKLGSRHFYSSKNLNKPIIDIFHDNLEQFNNFFFSFSNNYTKIVTIAK